MSYVKPADNCRQYISDEKWLNAIANGDPIPEPQNILQKYLKQIAENANDGGQGSITTKNYVFTYTSSSPEPYGDVYGSDGEKTGYAFSLASIESKLSTDSVVNIEINGTSYSLNTKYNDHVGYYVGDDADYLETETGASDMCDFSEFGFSFSTYVEGTEIYATLLLRTIPETISVNVKTGMDPIVTIHKIDRKFIMPSVTYINPEADVDTTYSTFKDMYENGYPMMLEIYEGEGSDYVIDKLSPVRSSVLSCYFHESYSVSGFQYTNAYDIIVRICKGATYAYEAIIAENAIALYRSDAEDTKYNITTPVFRTEKE